MVFAPASPSSAILPTYHLRCSRLLHSSLTHPSYLLTQLIDRIARETSHGKQRQILSCAVRTDGRQIGVAKAAWFAQVLMEPHAAQRLEKVSSG